MTATRKNQPSQKTLDKVRLALPTIGSNAPTVVAEMTGLSLPTVRKALKILGDTGVAGFDEEQGGWFLPVTPEPDEQTKAINLIDEALRDSGNATYTASDPTILDLLREALPKAEDGLVSIKPPSGSEVDMPVQTVEAALKVAKLTRKPVRNLTAKELGVEPEQASAGDAIEGVVINSRSKIIHLPDCSWVTGSKRPADFRPYTTADHTTLGAEKVAKNVCRRCKVADKLAEAK